MLLLALIFKSHILNLNFIILLWKRGVIRKLIYVSQIKLIFKYYFFTAFFSLNKTTTIKMPVLFVNVT